MCLFADDRLLYRTTITSTHDHTVLQDDLSALTNWANVWQMEFNVSKCNILQLKFQHALNVTILTV